MISKTLEHLIVEEFTQMTLNRIVIGTFNKEYSIFVSNLFLITTLVSKIMSLYKNIFTEFNKINLLKLVKFIPLSKLIKSLINWHQVTKFSIDVPK